VRALVCERPGEVALREIPEPKPAAGEVVVRVAAALTCGTDLKLVARGHPKVPFPVVLGHEFAGVVSAAGEGATFRPGDRVTSAVTGPCGRCGPCASGRENLCETAFDEPVWGAFADFVKVPARVALRGLRRIPDGLPFATAALLDPLASVLRGLARLPLERRGTHVILGTGPIAMMFALLLRSEGASRILVAGRRKARLARFRALGFATVEAPEEILAEAVARETSGRGAEVVVDAAGDPAALPGLVALAARGGTVLLFAGMPREAAVAVDAGRIHYDEVTLAGSFHYTPADASRALALLASGALPVDALVTGTALLSDFASAFDRVSRGEEMKVALVP
jgi:L-iditol 2-dehydrogenase